MEYSDLPETAKLKHDHSPLWVVTPSPMGCKIRPIGPKYGTLTCGLQASPIEGLICQFVCYQTGTILKLNLILIKAQI